MGRAKLKMEPLTSETKRNLAFKNKKATLMKRMHELTVLCDAKACMITYYGSKKEPQIWPENMDDEVRGLIDAYKNKDQSGRNKTYGLSEFFKDRKRKIDQELVNVRREIMRAKYPTWHESLDQLTRQELIGFAQALSDKAALVKSRVDQLKRSGVAERFRGHGQGMELVNYGDPRIDWGLTNRQQGIPFQPNEMCVPAYGFYHVPYVNDQNGINFANQNPMMNMLMNGTTDGDEFGNGFPGPVNMGNPVPGFWFNGPPGLPQMPIPLQAHMPQPPRQQQFPSEENYFGRQEDNFRY